MPSPLCCPALPQQIAETVANTLSCFRGVNCFCLYQVLPTCSVSPGYNLIANINRSRQTGNTKKRHSRYLGHSCVARFPTAAYLELNNQRGRVSTAYTTNYRRSRGRTTLGDTCTLVPGGSRDDGNGDGCSDIKRMGLKTREDLKPL